MVIWGCVWIDDGDIECRDFVVVVGCGLLSGPSYERISSNVKRCTMWGGGRCGIGRYDGGVREWGVWEWERIITRPGLGPKE